VIGCAYFFLGENVTPDPNPWMMLPFGLMLMAIALMPFINQHWWERHYPKVAIGLGAIAVGYYVFVLHNFEKILHVGHEYVSFICLIGSLFVVAGGIHIQVKGESTPLKNCIFLAVGAVLANIIGTTGASMLMIRSWIKSNRYRITSFHIVFFIFIISNVAGCLTPIGDPPLFLGFLKGVPFIWTLEKLWAPWIFAIGLLLIVFFVFDFQNFKRAPKKISELETAKEEWKFKGLFNFIFIGIIIGGILRPSPYRELIMIFAAAGSYFLTPKSIHQMNKFNFHPVKEVGWLFLGIFATMIPALDYLGLHAKSLGVDSLMEYYWYTGALSGVLDNAPTYLTFLTVAISQAPDPVTSQSLHIDSVQHVRIFVEHFPKELIAISVASVFFGAMTYIGNGPNFMVRTIAEQLHIRTPSFFGYIIKYSIPLLLPILAIVYFLFIR
jgi:Na+/H+ antiporter NhaD/arsenite permease-like protein